ncbi:MAG: glycosyltransferase [Magnetococcales bacterium]|nr:glycosyltransferase [Magnetococcales bacterium]
MTFRNEEQLAATLSSLGRLTYKPYEVIVVDGAATPKAKEICANMNNVMNIVYFGEPDQGIYDGMNKGMQMAKGDCVHYLNSGDRVVGEPYWKWDDDELLEVRLSSAEASLGYGKKQLWNTLYCHQGMLFPSHHEAYDLRFKIAADYYLMRKVYPQGFRSYRIRQDAAVLFDSDGLSSTKRRARNQELFKVITETDGLGRSLSFFVIATIKSIFPMFLIRAFQTWSNRELGDANHGHGR